MQHGPHAAIGWASMRMLSVGLVVSAVVLLSAVSASAIFVSTVGSPLFRVGEGGESWTAAHSRGAVMPASGFTGAEIMFYNTQVGMMGITSYVYSTPTLTPDLMVSDGMQTHTSLVMSWNPAGFPNDPILPVASWKYNYVLDPDLNGTIIEFSLFAPPGIWDVSLSLIDMNGNSRGWFHSMPPNQWTIFTIDPTIQGPQGGFNAYFQSGPFNLAQVVAIQLDES